MSTNINDNKNIHRLRSSMSNNNNITDDDIVLIVNKIKSSKALNGGFDKLEESIDELKTDLKEIKENLNHPDNGLYARIKNVDIKAEQSKKQWDYANKIVFLIIGVGITILGKFIFG